MNQGLVIGNYGTRYWYNNNQLHREDGPAVEYTNGNKGWYQNGHLHREGGPAIEFANGTKEWYQNGLRHRLDGPAIDFNGYEEWFIGGEEIDCKTNEEFLRIVKLKAFL